MDVLTHGDTIRTWEREATPLRSLHGAIASDAELLLYSPDPCREMDEIVSALALYEAAGGIMSRVTVAGPFPSREWTDRLRSAGVTRLYLAPARRANRDDPLRAEDLREIPRGLCPALHVRTIHGSPLGICGMKGGTLVLGKRQYARSCFGRWEACPHYAAGAAARSANGHRRAAANA